MNRSNFHLQSQSTNIPNSRYEIVEPRAFHETNNEGQGNRGIHIGEGAYGVVYKARDTVTGKYVALKKMKIDSETDGLSSSTVRETTLLMRLNHENVVKLEDAVFERDRMCLIFELLELDLRKYLDNFQDFLSEQTVRSFSAQLMSGLAYCHSMGIMHRDLKPQNILVSSNLQLKIADFGLARTFTPFARSLTIDVITRWYRAPEIILGQSRYNCSVDVWSVGCIIAEMSNKHPLFVADNEYYLLTKIFQKLGTPSNAVWPDVEDLPNYQPLFPQWPPQRLPYWLPNISPEGLNLMEKIFAYDPRRRISAKDSLRHPYLRPYVAANDLFDSIHLSLMQTPVAQHRTMSMPGNAANSSTSTVEDANMNTSSGPAYVGSTSTTNATQYPHVNNQGVSMTTVASSAAPVFLNKVTPDNNNSSLLISDNQQLQKPYHRSLQESSAQQQIDTANAVGRVEADYASVYPDQRVVSSTATIQLPSSSSNADSEVARYDPAAGRVKTSGKYFLPIDQPNLDYDDDELMSDHDDIAQRPYTMGATENEGVRKDRSGQLKADSFKGQDESIGILPQQMAKGKEFLGPNVSVPAKTVVARSASAAPSAPFPSLPTAIVTSAAPVSSASMFQPPATAISSSAIVMNANSVNVVGLSIVSESIASQPEVATRGRKRKVLDAMGGELLPLDSSLATKKFSVETTNVSTVVFTTTKRSASKKKNAVSVEDTVQLPVIPLENEFVGEDDQSTAQNDDNDDDDDKNLLACIAESIASKKLSKVNTTRDKTGKFVKDGKETQPTRRSTRKK